MKRILDYPYSNSSVLCHPLIFHAVESCPWTELFPVIVGLQQTMVKGEWLLFHMTEHKYSLSLSAPILFKPVCVHNTVISNTQKSSMYLGWALIYSSEPVPFLPSVTAAPQQNKQEPASKTQVARTVWLQSGPKLSAYPTAQRVVVRVQVVIISAGWKLHPVHQK